MVGDMGGAFTIKSLFIFPKNGRVHVKVFLSKNVAQNLSNTRFDTIR